MVLVRTMETPPDIIDKGKMRINVYDRQQGTPLANARVSISYTGNPETVINEVMTDSEGAVNLDELLTPPIEYSMEPGEKQPFSEYTIDVTANGYDEANISGIDVFSGETSIQDVYMNENSYQDTENNIVIPVNTLYGNYPEKIPESEIKPVQQSGEIVLSRVVIPETIVVHDGVPTDSTAQNYYVRYKDYIKNVASSEIYSTWPRQTLEANILAIMSFTLNRVYTEWYRNQGYNFTITSTTNYDHKYIHNRDIFDEISVVVDTVFNTFIKRPPTARQPLLAQYCDGKKSQCPNQMTQWGSKSLGDQGYNYEEILKYFYGDNILFAEAQIVSGVPVSFVGTTLGIGSKGTPVRTIQNQLNAISNSYPAIPKVPEDGIYGPATAEAVRTFQRIFGLPQTGVVDFKTWYEISRVYVAVTKIASLHPII